MIRSLRNNWSITLPYEVKIPSNNIINCVFENYNQMNIEVIEPMIDNIRKRMEKSVGETFNEGISIKYKDILNNIIREEEYKSLVLTNVRPGNLTISEDEYVTTILEFKYKERVDIEN